MTSKVSVSAALKSLQSLPNLKLLKQLLNVCESGDLEELKNLLTETSNIAEYINHPITTDQWTPLMVVAFHNHEPLLAELLNTSANVNSHRLKIDLYYQTPSGATVFDVANSIEIKDILNNEKARKDRLKMDEIFTGYHETSHRSFEYIINDYKKDRNPMVGGSGGYFGGGIYFAKSQKESSNKSLYKGRGFECKLKMGNSYKINSYKNLNKFLDEFCDRSQQYVTPIDVMKIRLLEKGYDSVWGINDLNIPTDERILKTGDEYVVYSADQIEIMSGYIIHYPEATWVELKESLRVYSSDPVRSTKEANYYLIPSEDNDGLNMETLLQHHVNPVNGDIIDYYNDQKPDQYFYRKIYIYYETKSYADYIFIDDLSRIYENADEIRGVKYKKKNKRGKETEEKIILLAENPMLTVFGFKSGLELVKHYKLVLESNQNQKHNYKIWIQLIVFKNISYDWKTKISENYKPDDKRMTPEMIKEVIDVLMSQGCIYTDGTTLYYLSYVYKTFYSDNQIVELNLKGNTLDWIYKLSNESYAVKILNAITDESILRIVANIVKHYYIKP
jgi:hypothetical protein